MKWTASSRQAIGTPPPGSAARWPPRRGVSPAADQPVVHRLQIRPRRTGRLARFHYRPAQRLATLEYRAGWACPPLAR